MKKLLVLTILIIFSLPLFSSNDLFISDAFLSPSLLAGQEIDKPFSFSISTKSSIDGLAFLKNPTSLDKNSREVVRVLINQDIKFWKDNPSVISAFKEFDDTFPSFTGNDEFDKATIDTYLEQTFLSNAYGAKRRSFVLSSLAGTGVINSVTGPGMPTISLSFSGENFKNEFGYRWFFSLGFDGSNSLFSSSNSELILSTGVSLSYSTYLTNKLSYGIALTPRVLIRDSILNENILKGRLNGDFISLFSEDFRFGLVLGVNSGLTYHFSNDFSITIDLRNFPAAISYRKWSLTDIAAFNFNLQKDHQAYAPNVELATTGCWKNDKNKVAVTFSSEDVFKITYERIINDSLALDIAIKGSELSASILWDNYKFGIMSDFDRFALGAYFTASI